MRDGRVIHNIALVGFMGVGKSSVGRLLAERLDFDYVDTDAVIESIVGKSISRIFAEDGEARFRDCEAAAVNELTTRRRLVIATGGGLAVQPGHLESLKSHALVVCLWASPEAIWDRVRHQSHRPLLQGPDPLGRIRQLLADREPFYRQADILVNTEMRSLKEVAAHVLLEFSSVRSRGTA
jgi:shikimate kinase